MATRRITTQEKTHLDRDEVASQGKSNIAPAVPKEVIIKLLLFTFAMIILPIGSYFVTLNTIYGGNSTFAGATAAVMANVVLLGYVVVAMKEDQSERLEAEEKERTKKSL
ncbi:hypothetical protein MBLNU459_g1766t1 [Dothideomycetes sp. NU459]